MNQPLKIFIIAGEPSGDLLGARLIKSMNGLLVQQGRQVIWQGVGGKAMQQAGLNSLVDIEILSVMGIMEILPRFLTIRQSLQQTSQAIQDFNPDLLITIDAPGFNLRIMKRVKGKIKAKAVHYVAPTVWAWKPNRVFIFKRYFDLLLTLLPFEPDYFTKVGSPSLFAGHSVVEDKMETHIDKTSFHQTHAIPAHHELLLILPGSRKSELLRHAPIFMQAVEKIADESTVPITPIMLTLPHLQHYLEDSLKVQKLNPQKLNHRPVILCDKHQHHQAMLVAKAALAASGTVSLELAMAKLPHLVAYRIHWLSYFILKPLVKTKFVNLINILLNKKMIPELLQKDCNANDIANAFLPIWQQKAIQEKQKKAFVTALEKLYPANKEKPSIMAAKAILQLIDKT